MRIIKQSKFEYFSPNNSNFWCQCEGSMPGVHKAKEGWLFGGSGEIRTHGGLSSSPVFKTGAFNHSATLPLKDQL